MDNWDKIFGLYAKQLREISWLTNITLHSDEPNILTTTEKPIFLNESFWSKRTHEIESCALQTLSNDDIDKVFDDVAKVMDENLDRFNPIINYFAQCYPDSEDISLRMDYETDMAHSIKRDLAWIAIEKVIGESGFFSGLLECYKAGRWPCDWDGDFPEGHVLCI